MLQDRIVAIFLSWICGFIIASNTFGMTKNDEVCDPPKLLGGAETLQSRDPDFQAALQKLGLLLSTTPNETQNVRRTSTLFDAIDRYYSSSDDLDEGTSPTDFFDLYKTGPLLTPAEAFKKAWESRPDTRNTLRVFADKAEVIKNRPDSEATHIVNNALRSGNFDTTVTAAEELLISLILRVIHRYQAVPDYIAEFIPSMDRLSALAIYRHILIIDKALEFSDDDPVFEVDEDIETEIASIEDQINILGARDGRLTTKPLPRVLPDKIHLIESEADLRNQGYSEDWIAGLDITKSSLQLAESLRRRVSNTHSSNRPSFAHTQHIPEFAEIIDDFIEFAEEGLRRQISDDKDLRLAQLQAFKLEAKNRQQSEQVTYRWFLGYTYRLAIVATPNQQSMFNNLSIDSLRHVLKENDRWTTHDGLEAAFNLVSRGYVESSAEEADDHLGFLLDQFPNFILIPTISDLGIMSVSRTYQTGVHLLQLINTGDPLDHYVHDIGHAAQRFHVGLTEDTKLFDRAFLYKLRGISSPQREWLEYLYYDMNHENVQVYPFRNHYALNYSHGIGIIADWEDHVASLGLVDSKDPNFRQTANTLMRRTLRNFRQIFSEIASERPNTF